MIRRSPAHLAALPLCLAACGAPRHGAAGPAPAPPPVTPAPVEEIAEVAESPAPPEPSVEPVREVTLPAPLPTDDARRRELAALLAAERPGWSLHELPCWFLATPVADPLLVEGVRERLEGARSQLHRELPPRRAEAHREKPLVLLYPDRRSYAAAGGPARSTGFWDPGRRELVAHDAPDERGEVTWPALQHMAVHAHLDTELGLAASPPWLLYGVGARYEGLRLRTLRSGGSALLPRTPEQEGALLRAALGDGPIPDLAPLLAADQAGFTRTGEDGITPYQRVRLASALVAFLQDPGPCGPPAVEERRRDLLTGYLAALQGGATQAAALEAALGPLTLAELEAAWRQWLAGRLGLQGVGTPPG